jgi:hypothetical protein
MVTPFSYLTRQRPRSFNVFYLRTLVTTCKQDNYLPALLHVINTITGTMIDPQLKNFTDISAIPRITLPKPLNTHRNTDTSMAIFKTF